LTRRYNLVVPACAVLSVASAFVQPTHGSSFTAANVGNRRNILVPVAPIHHTRLGAALDGYPSPTTSTDIDDKNRKSDSRGVMSRIFGDRKGTSPRPVWKKAVDMKLSIVHKLAVGINSYNRHSDDDVIIINEDLSKFGMHLKHHELKRIPHFGFVEIGLAISGFNRTRSRSEEY
jgi:hypothetical protein